jgi:dimethylaniline monooxygenase (N-oxide forming)
MPFLKAMLVPVDPQGTVSEQNDKLCAAGQSGRWLYWSLILAIALPILTIMVLLPWLFALIGAAWAIYILTLVKPWRSLPAESGSAIKQERVAIVGAGPSGIAALKEFVAAGHSVSCFEAGDCVGGLFPNSYDGTVLTSSAAVTAFSDFPPSPEEHRHFTKIEYLKYLNAYLDNFDVRRFIHLNTKVQRAHFDDSTGEWHLTIQEGSDHVQTAGPFDTLVVCSGLNQKPNLPVDNFQPFKGQVLHSKDYKRADSFAGKRVVVVGLGETSADVVAEIANVASSVVLSLRRGAYVIPRIDPLTGYPNDYDSNRLRYALPKWAHNLAVTIRDKYVTFWTGGSPNDQQRLKLLNLPGTPPPMNQFATKSDNFIHSIRKGRCRIAAGFKHFTAEGVVLADGEEVAADVVLFATGYRAQGFSFLEGESMPRCPSELWHLMYSPKLRERLVFIGFARPAIGAIPPISEIQARYAALVSRGQCKLPDPQDMDKELKERLKARSMSFDEPRIISLVDWIPYMDHLAAKIGCRIEIKDVILRPKLAWRLMTGTMLVAQYRLTGPDASPALAEKSLMLPGGMRTVDKLWFLTIHLLVAMTAIWEALPGRRNYRHCDLI